MVKVGTQETIAILSLQTTRLDLSDQILKETASKHTIFLEGRKVEIDNTQYNLKSWARMGIGGGLILEEISFCLLLK